MVVLVTGDGQDPTADALTVDSLGFPGAIRLLGGGLVLGCHAFVRAATSITDKIAADNVIARDIGTTHP